MTGEAGSGQTKTLMARICAHTGAQNALASERIQSLWSGYGEVVRVDLVGAAMDSVVVKCVSPPDHGAHPRGWNTDRSHTRKLRSYEVERVWYERFAQRCDAHCRVPALVSSFELQGAWYCILEDLDAAGFSARRSAPSHSEIVLGLGWLAHFHATFMGVNPQGLWPVGSYWHLATRPDELAVMQNAPLQAAARAIDARLTDARYQTLVHGDAKLANLCFAPDASAVSAVDFQYVGGGVGIKDVAYFLGSCLTEARCEREADALLDGYFAALTRALKTRAPQLDAQKVAREWQALYPFAWADFARFLNGWSPNHKKLHRYTERLTQQALDALSA